MIFIYLFITLFICCQNLVSAQDNYACDKNYCPMLSHCPSKFDCEAKNEMVLKNSTDCGCCHRCIKELEEGDECTKEMTYNTPDTQCGPHMMCAKVDKRNICKKISDVKEGCERTAYELSQKLSKVTTGEPIPDCDENGYYAATRCKNGTLCHCVDRNGTRIFGTDTYDNKKNMNCLCSRQFSEVNEKLGKYQIEATNFIRCKSNGNYEPFQMNTKYAYCMNTTSGEMLSEKEFGRVVGKSDQEKLACYDRKGDYSQETDCIKRYKNALKEIDDKKDKGFLVVGYDVPNCDIDGSFKPVQCLNSQCFCVNKKGEKYRGTKVDRNDQKYAVNQTCNCVRELELIRQISKNKWDKVTELFSQYICDKNGNYFPLQCSESVCYCVNVKTGFQEGPSVLKTNKAQMRVALQYPLCWDSYLDQRYEDYFQDQF